MLVLWLGYGMGSKIAMSMLVIYFPVTANFYDGLRHTQRGWLDLARVMLARIATWRWAVLRHIAIPAALPALASGLQGGGGGRAHRRGVGGMGRLQRWSWAI
jgi:putative hydroxymethylpyrimidine transport system permease protein